MVEKAHPGSQHQGSRDCRGELSNSAPEQVSSNSDRCGEISIAGSDPRAIKNPTWMNRYVGTFMKEYIRTKKKRLEQAIHNYQEQEYQCAYDPTTGETDCHRMCVSQLGLDISCPEKNLFKAQRDLEYLNLRSESLKFALTQPHSAAPFDLLSREHVILSHL